MVEVYDFVETADCAVLGGFPVGFEVDVVGLSVVVGFVLVEVKNVVVAACAEVFRVEWHDSLASSAFCGLWCPFELLVASVAEAFGMVLFLLFAIGAFFNHPIKRRSHIKNFVQTDSFRSFSNGRTSYNVYCANLRGWRCFGGDF